MPGNRIFRRRVELPCARPVTVFSIAGHVIFLWFPNKLVRPSYASHKLQLCIINCILQCEYVVVHSYKHSTRHSVFFSFIFYNNIGVTIYVLRTERLDEINVIICFIRKLSKNNNPLTHNRTLNNLQKWICKTSLRKANYVMIQMLV